MKLKGTKLRGDQRVQFKKLVELDHKVLLEVLANLAKILDILHRQKWMQEAKGYFMPQNALFLNHQPLWTNI